MPYPEYKPLGNRVYVRRTTQPTTTPGGIVLPDTTIHTACGVVVAVGPGGFTTYGKLLYPSVQVGDEVIFNRSALEVDVPMDDGTTARLVLLQDHEILGCKTVRTPKRRGRPPKHACTLDIPAGPEVSG